MRTSATSRPSKTVPRFPGEVATGQREPIEYRSTEWLDAVRELGFCVKCGKPYPQAAHRNEGKAKSKKVDDCLTAALCAECHTEIDQGKNMLRETRRAEMDRAIVLTVQALVRSGKVILNPDWRKSA